ncbi:deoxyribodipyrimidine photo-lyase [Chryseolinea sp. T2]|uniref:cryptochrome/photolyase family protein n=1 Tax=Chryseolinea sp. T2 TaxID=3129255 RepID=UPI003077051B
MSWKNDLSVLNENVTVFWFRRDLRLKDNAGLYHALKENSNVVPIFIFDTQILDELEDKADARVEFILTSVQALQKELREIGSSLVVLHGDPVQLFERMKVMLVYTNHDYEPYAISRDNAVAKILESRGGQLKTYKDQVIFDRHEVVKSDGKPYTVFTPYSKVWRAKLTPFYIRPYPTEKYATNLLKPGDLPVPSLKDIGFTETGRSFPPRVIPRGIIAKYDKTRDFPAIHGTTRLSVHLRFGTVSIRQLVRIAQKENQVWLNELIWREFYQMIMFHFPQVQHHSFRSVYDKIEWRNNEEEFAAWCDGRTGYPLVDAGMRELNETGFMHNRIRMVTASFLTKHLLIDWRWGEAYFGRKLLDYDLASNNGGWQWAAGTGSDAAPYFRVFNPSLQAKKFDPASEYIMQWVPEFLSEDYAKPIVQHEFARERALREYGKIKN